MYMDDTADLDYAAKRIIWGKMANLGQTCVAPDYILCTNKVRDAFIEKIKHYYREFFNGNPKKSDDLCRIINNRNFERLANMIR